MQPRAPSRHFGLDWLRIGAFALLIGYHVAMVFAPWHWVVKWPITASALVIPMALMTPWRLPLLFAVSGFATRQMIERAPSLAGFLRARAARLLVPLAFALVALLPPELWVRACETGYPHGLGRYWLVDYWRPDPAYGPGFPAWEHLWFVQYLFAYTALLVALVSTFGIDAIQRRVERVAGGARILWTPIALIGAVRLALMFVVPEHHALFGDWAGHAEYLGFFLFGVALGRSAALWQAIRHHARALALLPVIAGAVVAGFEEAYPGDSLPSHLGMATERLAQVAMGWAAVMALLAAADRWLNRDHRWRATLAEAVFPAYLIHHPAIVVATWLILPLGWAMPTAFTFLIASTALSCAGFYLVARETAWLRPLAGLSPAPATPRRRIRPA